MSLIIQPRIVALGNGVWLDEIRKDGLTPIKDVPGGSVTFGACYASGGYRQEWELSLIGCEATLGARLFLPTEPSSVSMVFNAGGDFPSATIELFRSWSISLTVHHQSDKPSARGLVFYEKANDNSADFPHAVGKICADDNQERGFSV